MKETVYMIGAGPGDPELITIKGKRLIDEADVIIYAGSLVNPAVLDGRKPEAKVYDSAGMTLDEVIDVIGAAENDGLKVVRVHTGDPSIYGAIREQMDRLEELEIPYEVVPGVSSFTASEKGIHAARRLPDRHLHPSRRTDTRAGNRTARGSCGPPGVHGDLPVCRDDRQGAGKAADALS